MNTSSTATDRARCLQEVDPNLYEGVQPSPWVELDLNSDNVYAHLRELPVTTGAVTTLCCLICPIKNLCHDFGATQELTGVYGGEYLVAGEATVTINGAIMARRLELVREYGPLDS